MGTTMSAFQTVMADPPWPYATPGKGPLAAGTKSNPEAWRGELTGNNVRARYGVMTMASIKALDVPSLVAENAHLYLWTTNAFRPITVITWTKVMKNNPAQASMKTGFYFRGATEQAVTAPLAEHEEMWRWKRLPVWAQQELQCWRQNEAHQRGRAEAFKEALVSIGQNHSGREALAAAYARGVVEETDGGP